MAAYRQPALNFTTPKFVGVLLFDNSDNLFITKSITTYWPNKWDVSAHRWVEVGEDSDRIAHELVSNTLTLEAKPYSIGRGTYSLGPCAASAYDIYRVRSSQFPRIDRNSIEDGRWVSLQKISNLLIEDKCATSLEIALQYLER